MNKKIKVFLKKLYNSYTISVKRFYDPFKLDTFYLIFVVYISTLAMMTLFNTFVGLVDLFLYLIKVI